MKRASFTDFTLIADHKFFRIIAKLQYAGGKQVVDGDWELLKCAAIQAARFFVSSQHVETAATKDQRSWNASKTPVWNIPKVKVRRDQGFRSGLKLQPFSHL